MQLCCSNFTTKVFVVGETLRFGELIGVVYRSVFHCIISLSIVAEDR